MIVFIPSFVPSGTQNFREFWAARHRRVKRERNAVRMFLNVNGKPPALPLTVTFRRCAPRLLDDDNLRACFKSVRDETAVWLGLPLTKSGIANDSDPHVTWAYEQEKTPKKTCGTFIRIEARV